MMSCCVELCLCETKDAGWCHVLKDKWRADTYIVTQRSLKNMACKCSARATEQKRTATKPEILNTTRLVVCTCIRLCENELARVRVCRVCVRLFERSYVCVCVCVCVYVYVWVYFGMCASSQV